VATTLYDELLHEEKRRSWAAPQYLLRRYFERVCRLGRTMRKKGRMNAQRGRGVDLRMDVVGRRMDIDDDDGGCRDELDWMVSVANEGRIEGEVETGNADLPGRIHHHHHHQNRRWHLLLPHYYSSVRVSHRKAQNRRRNVHFPTNFGSSCDS